MGQVSSTLAAAIEAAASADPSIGFRFVPDDGVPGFSKSGGTSEASFSYTALERASARYGGAFQALGLKKGDRLALICPANEDFVLSFFGAIRAGIVPVPIYPPLGIGQLQGYLDNTRHIVKKSGARALVTTGQIKRLLGTVQASCPISSRSSPSRRSVSRSRASARSRSRRATSRSSSSQAGRPRARRA